MISIVSKGGFENTERFLNRMTKGDVFNVLHKYGAEGVRALSAATPVDSGATASAWFYKVEKKHGSYSISWGNSNVHQGAPIAIMLQYGHGTGTGGYVAGRDYINPTVRPIFDRIAADVWKEVTSA